MTQSSFEFDAGPLPLAPVVPARPARKKAVSAPTPTLTAEALACTLEQHPDFRVLRRLVPMNDCGPAPAGARLQRILVLDTETTGLSHRSDKVIELAMLLVSVDSATGRPAGPVQVFEGFEDPGMPIPPIAREITGISDEMVKGQRLDEAGVLALVQQADLVVAHNAGFDRPFVEARFPAFADKPWACSFMDIDWKAAGAGSAKLSALANGMGWFYDAHRALVDCHALLQVLGQPVGTTDRSGMSLLLDAAVQPGFKLQATGAPFEAKDKLKARGYRWDAEARVWYRTLGSLELLDAERAWLRAEVYGRRQASVLVETLDSQVRYSARSGLVAEQLI